LSQAIDVHVPIGLLRHHLVLKGTYSRGVKKLSAAWYTNIFAVMVLNVAAIFCSDLRDYQAGVPRDLRPGILALPKAPGSRMASGPAKNSHFTNSHITILCSALSLSRAPKLDKNAPR
jgi:hypothetical protein